MLKYMQIEEMLEDLQKVRKQAIEGAGLKNIGRIKN